MSARRKKPEMLRRQEAVAATRAKYGAREFDWKSKATCLHMARFHLVKMGRKPPRLPQVGSLLAARKALNARGWGNVADMLDAIGLERIPPAFLRLGDLVATGSDDELGSIFVSSGESKFIGWTTEMPAMAVVDVFNPDGLLGAWRV